MSQETTVPLLHDSPPAALGGENKVLLIVRPDLLVSYPLPRTGALDIGRAETAQVRIDDPAASRRHATLRLGDTFTIEDHGGANGTQLRGQSIPPHLPIPLQVGEAVTIGSTSLMIQVNRKPVHARRLWPHVYFEGRLDDECQRAQTEHRGFAVVRIHVRIATPLERLLSTLEPALLWSDAIAAYGPEDYEILLGPRLDLDLQEVAHEIADRLAEGDIEAETAFACFPQDGLTADALLGVLSERIGGEKAPPSGGDALVLGSPNTKKVYEIAARAAASDISVLILGETGVGKDVLARFIASRSPRASKPFVSLNCAAFADNLLESELFGHEKGAFTGAVQAKPGLLEAAPGGTVFLDEVGEMSASMQARLLRVIESREVLRVGALKPRPIDVRFIAATNRQLEVEVERKAFRQDLFYRLNGMSLYLPPLRERPEDVVPLALRFIAEACERSKRSMVPILSPEALSLLKAYCWPGNIRELKNFMERAVVLCPGTQIRTEHLPVEKMSVTLPTAPPKQSGDLPDLEGLDEEARITRALAFTAGNQTRAAALLGIPRRTFLRRLERYSVSRPVKAQDV